MGDGGHVADTLLGERRRLLHQRRVSLTDDHQSGEEDHRDQRQQRVDHKDADYRDQHQQNYAHREGQRLEDHGGRLHVDVGVGQQLPGRLRAMEAQRHIEVVPQQPAPPVPLGSEFGHRQEEAANHDTDTAQQRHTQQRGHRQPDGRARDRPLGAGSSQGAALESRNDQLVGDAAEHPGAADRGEHEHHRSDHRKRVRSGMGAPRTGDQTRSAAPNVVVDVQNFTHGARTTASPGMGVSGSDSESVGNC